MMRHLTALLSAATLLVATPAFAGPRPGTAGVPDTADRRGPSSDRGRDHDRGHTPSTRPAQAHPSYGHRPTPPPPPAGVEIDNHSGVPVDVYIDHRLVGTVSHRGEQVFSTLPGRRDVEVRARGSGILLLDVDVSLQRGRIQELDITRPRTRVTVVNSAPAPLYVAVTGQHDGFWLLPGRRDQVTIEGFEAQITGAVHGRRGLQTVDTEVVRPLDGRHQVVELGWSRPTAVGQLQLHNHEPYPVSVYLEGDLIAVLGPNGTQTVTAPYGRHSLTVARRHGPTLYTSSVRVGPHGLAAFTIETRLPHAHGVVFGHPGRRPIPAVATAPSRPSRHRG